MDVTLASVVEHSHEPLTAEIDGEIVMLSVEQEQYFGLDRVGARIWSLVAEPRPVGEVVDRLLDEFEVAPETCRTEVLAFLDDLAEAKLLRVRA